MHDTQASNGRLSCLPLIPASDLRAKGLIIFSRVITENENVDVEHPRPLDWAWSSITCKQSPD